MDPAEQEALVACLCEPASDEADGLRSQTIRQLQPNARSMTGISTVP